MERKVCEGRKAERKEEEERGEQGRELQTVAGAARRELDYKLLGRLKRTNPLNLLGFYIGF